MISYFEYTLQIPKEFKDAFKVFCNVRDCEEEKSLEVWKELFKKFLNKSTN